MGNNRQRRWLKPAIWTTIVIVLAIAAYLAYRAIYNWLFNGNISVNIDDVYATIDACKVPLIVVGAVMVMAIAGSIAVFRRQRHVKALVRTEAVVAVIAAIVVAANVICLNIEYSLMQKVLTGSSGVSVATKQASKDLSRDIVDEGIVLLRNEDNALPLDTDTKLNVFGYASVDPLYAGTGSGGLAASDDKVSLLDGLHHAGYKTNQTLTDFYENYDTGATQGGQGATFAVDWTVNQPTIDQYDEQGVFENAKEYSDTALVVISRTGGEGNDLPTSLDPAKSTENVTLSRNEDDLDANRHYLQLTHREEDMMNRVNQDFDNVIVVVNTTNAMQLDWLDQYSNIKAAVLCGGAGTYGFDGLGDVLSGKANPSGRLADTYLYDLRKSPNWNNFGSFAYTNYEEASKDADQPIYFVNYNEGIYVGYKFYETAAAEGLIDYDKTVQYPFGYGLSYTTFDKRISGFKDEGDTVKVSVDVTNTGDVAGKEVVELFFTPPYTNGGIEKASTNLLDFAKTGELKPGESETVTISFKHEDLASYDDKGYKAYVLEQGDYEITLNEDSHTVLDSRTLHVDDDVIYDDAHDGKRSTDNQTATNQFDFADGDVTYLSRADHFANYAAATAAPTSYEMTEEQIEDYQCRNTFNASDYDDENAAMPTTGADNGLTIQDMTGLDYNDPKWDDLLDQLTVQEMDQMSGDGGFHIVAAKSINSPDTIESDGPAGLSSNFNSSMNGTSFPSATVIASTWNKDLARQRGEQVGQEADEMSITGWYGPAMNIHRSAFSGRNFEYYSEDGTLSGFLGAAEVGGATSKGVIVYLKHFALNDQETNRVGVTTWANEQSIREIYLKAFEKSFKEGKSLGVMSSLNAIGGQWAGSSEALMETVLRDEWGFHGVAVTDAWANEFVMDADRGIRTGTTKILSMNAEDSYFDNEDSAGTVIALRNAAHENLYALANSNAMKIDTGMAWWVKAFIAADVVIGLIIVAVEVLAIKRFRKESAQSVSVAETVR